MIRADLESAFLAVLRPLCADYVALSAAVLCAHVAQAVGDAAARRLQGDDLAASALYRAARDAFEFGMPLPALTGSTIAAIEEHARIVAEQLAESDEGGAS